MFDSRHPIHAMRIAVVVPVYLPILTDDERISFIRKLDILGKHGIMLVCPEGLDTVVYEQLAGSRGVSLAHERFEEVFFQGTSGYNRLLLSPLFYMRFSNYDYLLICQLDAYVFRDELMSWCQKGYDFLGPPLFDDEHPVIGLEGMKVGNGGFSLRKVQTYIDYFQSRKHVFSPGQIARRISLWKKPHTRLFVWLFMCLGWRNKPVSIAARYRYNEDIFWSLYLEDSRFQLKKPAPEEALSFAFERFPKELYEFAGRHLPFGCHGWRRYEYEEFWKDYIRGDE